MVTICIFASYSPGIALHVTGSDEKQLFDLRGRDWPRTVCQEGRFLSGHMSFWSHTVTYLKTLVPCAKQQKIGTFADEVSFEGLAYEFS
jgi:hypothetical protein